MAGPVREFEGINDADRRHFDFVQTLLRVSEELTDDETANVKLFCMHLIPKSKSEKLRRAVDVFVALMELCKIDQENLDFVEEILERIGRQDLVRDILRPFQPPDREIPENPELQPGTSAEGANADGATMSDTYLVINGQRHMIQETIDQHRRNIASLCGVRRSQVKFRGYKKGKSILVHFSIPRENTAVLRLMANHSDPRLVYMGVKSLQIDTEVPIEVTRETLWNDVKRQLPADDIEVGCKTPTKRQRAPKNWTHLSALNLFSDTLPLHLQVAESLEYQGFSYSLVQALVQKDQLRDQQMRRTIQNLRKAEVDSNTLMTMRSKLTITGNMLKEAQESITVLEKELQQAREDTEKAKQVMIRFHGTGYTGEKPFGGWSADVEKADVATQTHVIDGKHSTQIPEDNRLQEELDDAESSAGMPELDGGEFKQEERSSVPSTMEQITQSKPAAAEGTTDQDVGRRVEMFTRHSLAKSKINYDGRASEHTFKNPRGVAVSGNDIFVADTGNKQVQVHSMDGVYLRHFSTIVPGTGGMLMKPFDVSIRYSYGGNLWVIGRGRSADYVVQYSTDGKAVSKFGLPMSGDYRGIAVDMRNNILVTEASHVQCEVHVFRPDGKRVRRFRHQDSGMQQPEYITVDRKGSILLTDSTTHSVYVFDEFGKFLFKFGGEGSGKGQLLCPNGICTDSSGNIIVADCRNSRVQIFTSDGEYVRHVDNGCWTEGVAIGPHGHLVVTNFYDHTVSVYRYFSY
ncbi:uncharacterized protein [Branchiostoma lanceolatum]|uniref:uncharacterized protein n=1 Tax=Branchiostoma lanceolatum TaxID=7740 RepID=UPI0034563AE8